LHWKTKAAAFRILSAVPFGKRAHFFLQRHLTKNWPRKASDVVALVGLAKNTIGDFNRYSATRLADATFLELGAGRDLAVPLALKMLGAGRVLAIDISRLCRLDLVNHAARVAASALGTQAPRVSSWNDLLDFGVDYRAPLGSAGVADLPPYDAVISNEVLEHIEPTQLQLLMTRLAENLSSGGLSIHSIDYSDHYARGAAVSRYNFLKFSDKQWRPYNSPFQYVNRLRHSEYLTIFERTGLRIVHAAPYAEPLPADIHENLAPQFRQFAADDINVMRARIVAQKP